MTNGSVKRTPRTTSLSYKFQRLREKLRQAISSGELAGKLPGERVLARRFHVNAKTLSKALTDLAAEGLLERSIGRGTYVKGSAPPPQVITGRWLLLCDPEDEHSPLVQLVLAANPQSQIVTERVSMRPSFLNQFSAVVDFASGTPEVFLRDLVVRNIPVVTVGREPKTYSMHAVVIDRALGVSYLARDLLLAGHRRLGAIEERTSTIVSESLRKAAARYAPDATIDIGFASDAAMLVEQGITALVCDSVKTARQVLQVLAEVSVERQLPRISLGATGCADGDVPCSGYYVRPNEMADAVLQLLQDSQTHRPATLWLAGRFVERNTLGVLQMTDELNESEVRSPRPSLSAIS